MAQRRLQGLQRVLGVNAWFATAYGNVGSSIYYALGLVAALALGLTPLVFVITGIFFFCTAAGADRLMADLSYLEALELARQRATEMRDGQDVPLDATVDPEAEVLRRGDVWVARVSVLVPLGSVRVDAPGDGLP